MKGVRVWHNLYPVGDIVEYVPGMMWGVMDYPKSVRHGDTENGRWLATMMTEADVHEYLDWCHYVCNKIIYNKWLKEPDQDEWL